MGNLLKKIMVRLIWLLLIFIFTGWIVRGIYHVVFQSSEYISFASPMVHLTKYFASALFIFIMIYRYFTLTRLGKIIIPSLIVLSIFGLLVSSLWFNAVNEKEIVKFRVIYPIKYSWGDVDYVSSEIYHESRSGIKKRHRMKPRRVIAKYNIHLINGSSINIWSNHLSIYTMHQFVIENEIDVKYLTEAETFDQNFKSYFGKELPMAHFVFGIKE